MTEFKRGDQVKYVPTHVLEYDERGKRHPAIEYGFVTSVSTKGTVYCRYRTNDGELPLHRMRTLSTSEGCHPTFLRHFHHMDQGIVEKMLQEIHEYDEIRTVEW